jgi:DNA-binding NarL/FixJ family response regulator
MMDAGAVGYLDKEMRAEQLINAIRRAASGENLYDEQKKRERVSGMSKSKKNGMVYRNEKNKFCIYWRRA